MQFYGVLLVALGLSGCSSVASPAPAAELRVPSADGVAIAYEERGQGLPALVFVHGWCGERGFWRAPLEAFAPTHRVIALDLAGHGASGAGRTRWSLASLAEDVRAVVVAARAEDVILIGHSMGAPVALLAAAQLAPRVRGVIGVDSLHDADFAYPPGFLEQVALGLEADFPRALEASIRAVTAPAAPAQRVEWILARAARTDRAAAIALLRGLEGFQLGAALAGARVPVRVINSAARPSDALVTAVERNRRLADFDALLLEDAGHFPMIEQPERFVALLRHWVDELSARPAPDPR